MLQKINWILINSNLEKTLNERDYDVRVDISFLSEEKLKADTYFSYYILCAFIQNGNAKNFTFSINVISFIFYDFKVSYDE